MKRSVFSFLFFLVLVSSSWAVDYAPFNYPDADGGSTYLTGIRGDTDPNVVMTGVYTPVGTSNTQGLIYSGALDNSGVWNVLNATISGETVTSTALYGPNTVSPGTIIVVGSYKNNVSGAVDHGLLYTGAPDGSGTYQNLDAALPGEVNTIAHSTHGNMVVGNYDTGIVGKAFVYNLTTPAFSDLSKPGALSITAYGVWHNSGTSYTIAGGFSNTNGEGLDEGYLVDYDSSTGLTTHWTEFNYNNASTGDLVSHFDGITGDGADGYNLTGDWLGAGETYNFGFFAHIGRNEDGTFTSADWTDISYTGALLTSGNSVFENTVIGIYLNPGDPTTYGYLATVPEPNIIGLIALGGFVVFVSASIRFGRLKRHEE
ncbi:MAG: hypothetical protein ABI443_00235 [Chthoniobacterales bacterium]